MCGLLQGMSYVALHGKSSKENIKKVLESFQAKIMGDYEFWSWLIFEFDNK